MKNKKSILIEGPIGACFIADKISAHQRKTEIGAHSIFLGQVRADEFDGRPITAIEYSCYEEMVFKVMQQIREQVFNTFQLSCLHVYHSIGKVPTGEICLFAFTSSVNRKDAVPACAMLVEMIKAQLPIWGKEVVDLEKFRWKVNS